MHDEIVPAPSRVTPPIGVSRPTNNAGGLEGGITNGEDLRVSGFMKPIATLMKPLRSVDLADMAVAPAVIERSDVCAISAAAVVGEAVVSLVLGDAFLEKFSGDSLGEIRRNYNHAADRLKARFSKEREGGPAASKRQPNEEREGG
jgi:chorismate synthase